MCVYREWVIGTRVSDYGLGLKLWVVRSDKHLQCISTGWKYLQSSRDQRQLQALPVPR